LLFVFIYYYFYIFEEYTILIKLKINIFVFIFNSYIFLFFLCIMCVKDERRDKFFTLNSEFIIIIIIMVKFSSLNDLILNYDILSVHIFPFISFHFIHPSIHSKIEIRNNKKKK
jgi:hypothetical protein